MFLILCFACNYLVKGSLPLAPYSPFHVLLDLWGLGFKASLPSLQKPADGRTNSGLRLLGTMAAPEVQDWVCLSPFQFDSLRQQLSRGVVTPPASTKDSVPSSSQTAETRSVSPLRMTMKARHSFRVQKHWDHKSKGLVTGASPSIQMCTIFAFPGDRRAWMPIPHSSMEAQPPRPELPGFPPGVVGPQPPSWQIGSLGGESFQIIHNLSKLTPSKDILWVAMWIIWVMIKQLALFVLAVCARKSHHVCVLQKKKLCPFTKKQTSQKKLEELCSFLSPSFQQMANPVNLGGKGWCRSKLWACTDKI